METILSPKISINSRSLAGSVAFILSLTLISGVVKAAEISAVLSSDLSAYQEAFSAFRKNVSGPVTVYSLDNQPSKYDSSKIVVAFGGKAVLDHPEHKFFVYCLAPNVEPRDKEKGLTARIEIVPPPDLFVERVKHVQPNLRTLAVLWKSETFDSYVHELGKDAKSAGFHIIALRADSVEQVPEVVRKINGKVDAIWMLPDSELVKPDVFSLVAGFAKEAKIVFYAPSISLVKKGASAAILPDYADIGQAAAEAVKTIQAGNPLPEVIFPSHARVVISRSAFEFLGLSVSPAASEAGETIP